jgi:hypothetical protein
MKKILSTSLVTIFILTLLIISGCGEKGPSGTKGEVNLLTLLPDSATGVMVFNFKKFSQLKFFDDIIKEKAEEKADTPKAPFKDYQDFVNKTGIDPKKDIHAMAIGFIGKLPMGGAASKEPDFVAVLNLNYNKEKIMTVLKEEGAKYTEENYNGVQILNVQEDPKQDVAVCFLNENTVVAGKNDAVKKTIDLSKGTGQCILKNVKLKPYIDAFKPNVIVSMAFEFPEEARKVQDGGMFKVDVSKAEAIVGSIDYEASVLNGALELISKNEQANKDLVNTLNGLKGMGAMAGPEVAELVNNINLAASADKISLTFSISDELVEKLKKKMGEKAKGIATPPSE